MEREIDRLANHVILCGFGRMGQVLAENLQRRQEPFLVVERDAGRIAEAANLGYRVLSGDATEEETLLAAGVSRATTLVSSLDSDAANVFLTLTSKNLNPELRVIARGEQPSTEKKLRQAGADRVVMPTVIGARRISTLIAQPHTADLMDQVADHDILDVELDETQLPDRSPLVGMTIRDAEARRRHGLVVVAIKRSDGEMVFNPDADCRFSGNDTLILMGPAEGIAQFRTKYNF